MCGATLRAGEKNTPGTVQSYNSMPGDHQFKEEESGSVGELTKVCSQIVLECLYLAHIGRPDILWSENKLARAVTKLDKSL